MRLLIFLAILYFFIKVLKKSFKILVSNKIGAFQQRQGDNSLSKIDDVMIQDPYCKIYFPKRCGVHARVCGKDLYFCSVECKNKFLELSEKKV